MGDLLVDVFRICVPAEQSWAFSIPTCFSTASADCTTEQQSSPFSVKTYSDSRFPILIPLSASTFHTEKYRHPA